MEKSEAIGSVSIGHQLKKFRELAGMKQYQMAALLHLGETTYGNYERGVREPGNLQPAVDDVSSMQEDIKYIAKMVCQIRNKLGREDERGAR